MSANPPHLNKDSVGEIIKCCGIEWKIISKVELSGTKFYRMGHLNIKALNHHLSGNNRYTVKHLVFDTSNSTFYFISPASFDIVFQLFKNGKSTARLQEKTGTPKNITVTTELSKFSEF